MTPRVLTVCAAFGLALASLPAFAAPPPAAISQADTPAVTVVRAFLADRAAGNYDAAYALLSGEFQKNAPEKELMAGDPIPPAEAAKLPAALVGIAALIGDMHNTQGRAFTVIGPDPALPGAVLVRAVPPGVTFSLLTTTDVATYTLRIEPTASLQHASPKAFAQSRENAERSSSQSNLKQLALGVIQYTQDHDEKMPDAASWGDEILPFVHTEALFRDPSAPAGEKWSYAYNSTLSGVALAKLDSPAQTVMLFESNAGAKNASDTGRSVPKPGRHNGGTDYAFADGHVIWLRDGVVPSYTLLGK